MNLPATIDVGDARATVSRVLAKAALFDPTFVKPDLGVLAAWTEALGNIHPQDALDAVTAHYRHSPDRLMPVHVLEYCRIMGRRRREADLNEQYAAEMAARDVDRPSPERIAEIRRLAALKRLPADIPEEREQERERAARHKRGGW